MTSYNGNINDDATTLTCLFFNTAELTECIIFVFTQYISHVRWIHMYHLFYNSLVRVIYSRVLGQCTHAIPLLHVVFSLVQRSSTALMIYNQNTFVIGQS